MADRRKELAEMVSQLDTWTEREALLRLSKFAASEDIHTLLAVLPPAWRPRFTAWIAEARANPSLLQGLDAAPQVLERFDAFAQSPAASTPRLPNITDEDRAVLEQMRANRAKYMQSRAGNAASKPVPVDGSMQERWRGEEFLNGGSGAHDGAFHLQRLEAGDAQARATSLKALAALPVADERILRAAEALLGDRTITLLGIPYTFGEVRWLAVETVAALRGALGAKEAVVLDDVMTPVAAGDVGALAAQAGIAPSMRAGVDGLTETLERVAAAGKLPRRRIQRSPFVPSSE